MVQTILIAGSTIIAVFMAFVMIFIRAKAARQPTNVRKIILPPIFMSTGALMFVFPAFRLSGLEIIEAIGFGVILSVFLILTTRFEIKQHDIYLIPSKSFILILLGLLIVRTTVKLIIGSTISFGETSGLFYLLALGMIFSWRIAMLIKYQQLKRNVPEKYKTYVQQ